MKKLVLFLALIAASFAAHGQTIATKDKDGNFVQVAAKPKTTDELTEGCQKSAAMFTDKDGNKYPVYLSKNGKMFIVATSKTSGRPYRRYFKIQE